MTGPFSGVPNWVSRPTSPAPRANSTAPRAMISRSPPTSMIVAALFAASDWLMPHMFSSASSARNTVTTTPTGQSTNAPR